MTYTPVQDAEDRLSEALRAEAEVLDLSDLGLRELPRGLHQLESLRELYLNNNPLGRLPEGLGRLARLEVLYATGCDLVDLPDSLTRIPGLRKLVLSRNRLSTYPFQRLVGLEELVLADNDLAQTGGLNLPGLRVLDLARNHITRLPALPPAIEALDISGNEKLVWPGSIQDLAALRYLRASDCTGYVTFSTFSHLSGLRHLSLVNTPVHLDDGSLRELVHLQVLRLVGCMLKKVPPGLGRARELRELDLAKNSIHELPDELFILPRLHTLDLSSNPLLVLPEQVGQLASLRQLRADGAQLKALPASIGQLRRLRTLSAANNHLRGVPASLWQLRRLEALDLEGNQIETLGRGLASLTALASLKLNLNALTALPAELTTMSALEVLSVGGNQLAALPEIPAGGLPQLRELHLHSNKLRALPASLQHLPQLRHLDLSHNELAELPRAIGELLALRTLLLRGNQLAALPPTLTSATGLTTLELAENPGLGLPSELLSRPLGMSGDEHARSLLDDYWRTRAPKRRLNEAKMLLVGRGEVGKTSLVQRLVHDSFDPVCSKTQGIQIEPWILRIAGETVRVRVWDFGGQEIMHATHQFFLTERSLYLLVLNGREGGEDHDVVYWLKLISSLGGDSPVLIVMNKTNQHPCDLNRRGLVERFPSIRGFVHTDCRDGRGVAELRERIVEALAAMPDVATEFPARWFAIKDRLSALDRNYLTLEEYRQLCRDHGIDDPGEQDAVARLLHQLGIVLHYRSDPRLRDTNVLNPHWVTRGIYKILNDPRLRDALGELRADDLADILSPIEYPVERHAFLLELMRRFQLCFAYPDEAGPPRYLIPELLSKEEPDLGDEFSARGCLNFEYHYSVLPEGLVARFLVRAHVLSQDPRRWRTGAVLQRGDCSALVKTDIDAKKVLIRVRGPARDGSRRELLAVIRYDFERIHGQLRRLEVHERVPVPDHPGYALDYRELVALQRAGDRTTRRWVGERLVEFNIDELLQGIDVAGAHADELAGAPRPLRAFISYSHKDEHLREELETHLKLMQRQGLLAAWTDRKIAPGSAWMAAIDDNIKSADLILVLVSADFLASHYCYEVELNIALDRHARGEARLVPLYARTCDLQGAPLGRLQGLPRDARPVTTWPDRDAAWTDIARGLRALIAELRSRTSL